MTQLSMYPDALTQRDLSVKSDQRFLKHKKNTLSITSRRSGHSQLAKPQGDTIIGNLPKGNITDASAKQIFLIDKAARFRLANTSVVMVQQRQRKYAEQRMAKQQNELELCTFKPQLQTKKKLSNNGHSRNSINLPNSSGGHHFNQLYHNASQQQLKMAMRREQKEKEEKSKCTFKPNVSQSSRQPLNQKENADPLTPKKSNKISKKAFQKIYQCSIEDIVKQCVIDCDTSLNKSVISSARTTNRKSLVFNKKAAAKKREGS